MLLVCQWISLTQSPFNNFNFNENIWATKILHLCIDPFKHQEIAQLLGRDQETLLGPWSVEGAGGHLGGSWSRQTLYENIWELIINIRVRTIKASDILSLSPAGHCSSWGLVMKTDAVWRLS